MFNTDRISM